MQGLSQWLPTVITFVTVIFGAGAIYGRIKDQEIVVTRHETWLNEHDKSIGGLEMQAAESRGFQNGFQAAKDGR